MSCTIPLPPRRFLNNLCFRTHLNRHNSCIVVAISFPNVNCFLFTFSFLCLLLVSVEPGVWPTQGTPLHETSQFNNSLETDAQPDGMFGHNNNDNLTSDLQYQEVPKIDIQLEFLQQENDEDIYDDGTTVRPSQRPESVVYAETYTLHKPRGLEPTTASEPIYNNVTSCVNGDDTSQSSYYMQLMTNTPDNESNDQYTIIGQRQPKDNTEQWEPPHV